MKIQMLFLALLLANVAFSQCNCEQIHRDDGTIITQCIPLPVAYDNTTQIGLALSSNGEDDFLSVTVRFKHSAKELKGGVSIRLDNNQMMSFELFNGGLAYIGNSEVAQGVYLLPKSKKLELRKSRIKTLSIKLNDNLLRTYEATSNRDVLMKQVDCL